MKFEDLQALLGLHRVDALMNILENHVLYVLLLYLKKSVDVGKLLMPVPGQLINYVLMVVSETLLHKQNCLIDVDGNNSLVVLGDFSLEVVIGILVVHRSVRGLGFFLQEFQFLLYPIHEVGTVRCV